MGALCSALQAGEIVIFDKAYVHFINLFNLQQRGVFWITRAKDNMAYKVRKRLQRGRRGNIVRDDLIKLSGVKARAGYPELLRRVEAEVQINGKTVVMVFITNNVEWAASWPHSFKRLFTLIRGVVWDRFNLFDILEFYGTVGGKWRMRADPENAYLSGWEPKFYETA